MTASHSNGVLPGARLWVKLVMFMISFYTEKPQGADTIIISVLQLRGLEVEILNLSSLFLAVTPEVQAASPAGHICTGCSGPQVTPVLLD